MRTSRPSLTDLLYQVEQRRRALLSEALLPWDLNLTQWTALCILARRGPCTMTELAQATAVDRTSLTRTIDSLLPRGLVARSTPPKDRRTVLVEASPEGRQLADALLAKIHTLENQWLEVFDETTRDRLAADLDRLLTRLSSPDRRTVAGQ